MLERQKNEKSNSLFPSEHGNLVKINEIESTLLLLKIKRLWNQIKIRLKINNETHCRSEAHLAVISVLNKYKFHVRICSKKIQKFSRWRKLRLKHKRLKLQHQIIFKAADQLIRQQELQRN